MHQQRYAAVQSLFAQMDASWAQTGGLVKFADAKKLANVITQAEQSAYRQLEKAGFPPNLLSSVWQKDSLEVYANGLKSFVITWDWNDGDALAEARPVAA